MTRADPQLKIRLPEGLKTRIELLATAAGRSMNAEVVARLEASTTTLDEPLKKLRMDVTQAKLEAIQERHRAETYALALAFVAERMPPEAFADNPVVAQAMDAVRGSTSKRMMAYVERMLLDTMSAVSEFDARIQSGDVKVRRSDGSVIPAEDVKPVISEEQRTSVAAQLRAGSQEVLPGVAPAPDLFNQAEPPPDDPEPVPEKPARRMNYRRPKGK